MLAVGKGTAILELSLSVLVAAKPFTFLTENLRSVVSPFSTEVLVNKLSIGYLLLFWPLD